MPFTQRSWSAVLIGSMILVASCSDETSDRSMAELDVVLDRYSALHQSVSGTIEDKRLGQQRQHVLIQQGIEKCMAQRGFEYSWVAPLESYELSSASFDTTRLVYSGWFSALSQDRVSSEGLGLEYAKANEAAAGIRLDSADVGRVRSPGEEKQIWQDAQSDCFARIQIPAARPDLAEGLSVELVLLEARVLEDVADVGSYEECMRGEGFEFVSQPSDLVENASSALYQDVDAAPTDTRQPEKAWLRDREREIEWAMTDAACRRPIIDSIYEDIAVAIDEFEARNESALSELTAAWADFR